eukprot:CAMPEP_0184484438 /NCGR_PEP_ID=MMETSP0113_2-20130426/6156_1 /TAXON_ID=91329 /ORGANISM="Norrisiella sphaerica, Strain BC52" /LENGTH=277 /DNA_ID=CAMNT_0026865431 /DNA_START=275 /DNA_END=1108 /DNA_ORIENTATION=+
MTSKLAKRVAVVTGGNKGIGFEIVRKLASQQDVSTILTARSKERGESACEKLKLEGLKVEFAPLDLTDKKSISSFAEWFSKKHGKLDILVNNAGIAFKGSDPTPFKDQAEPTMKTNFWGTLNVCDALIPLMKDGGNIVNVASQSGTSAFSNLSKEKKALFKDPKLDRKGLETLVTNFCEDVKAGKHSSNGWANSCYGTSKLAVIFLTQILAKQLKERNILCNSMCPGYCATDMSSHKGPRSAAQGADTAAWLALKTKDDQDRPNGGFFYDRKLVEIK